MTHNRAPAVGSGGPTDEKPSEPSWFLRLLDRLPPLIQALTPLIIFLVGGAGGVAIGHATTPAPQPTATVTVTATPSVTTPPTNGGTNTAPPPTPVWSGPISVSESNPNGIDFDSVPPGSGPNSLSYNGATLNTGGSLQIATWTNSSAPTRDHCSTWAQTHPSTSEQPYVGTGYCLITGQGHTVYLKVTKITPATFGNGTVYADAIVWMP